MNINSLFIKSLTPPSNVFNYQIVRWLRPRKPFWLGRAKTKMFVIPQPKLIRTPEEKEDYTRLSGHYETHLNSLFSFMGVNNSRVKGSNREVKEVKEEKEENLSPEMEKMIEESWKNNEAWNAKSAVLREERLKGSLEKQMEKAIKEIDEFQERKLRRMEFLESVVRKEKEMCVNYVTPENLDEAVEKCLDNVVCYDFAIDLQGNKYEGRETLPSPFKNEKAHASAFGEV